jgi:hypothetical protein
MVTQQEALICCLNLQEHIIIIITIRTTKTQKNKNPQMMKQNLISSWKTYRTIVKCFWKCGVFFR